MSPSQLVLAILDGFGWAPPSAGNALRRAATPTLDRLLSQSPPALLDASGPVVGLPAGQPGNSEVGHLTIGAGRTIAQANLAIGQAIADGSFFRNPALLDAFARARAADRPVHVIGLTSRGGAHSHLSHLEALVDLAGRLDWQRRTFLHAVTDGRDVPATQARDDLADLERSGVQVATVFGRQFAMDRSGNWPLTDAALHALTGDPTPDARSAVDAVERSYAAGRTDQWIEPVALPGDRISAGDQVILANFRPDGLRQLVARLRAHGCRLTTMTRYDPDLADAVAFPAAPVSGTLAAVVAAHGLRQLHVAEEEKYAHVTYFLDGYRTEPYPGEECIKVPSRRDRPVMDQAPQMSAEAITDVVLEAIRPGGPELVVANFANVDTVAHTGDAAATAVAAEWVDRCLDRLVVAAAEHGVTLALTGDHGNGEQMLEDDGRTPCTRHTLNPVPFILPAFPVRRAGDLTDVAPTCLALLGLPAGDEMTGRPLCLPSEGPGDRGAPTPSDGGSS